MQGRRKRKRRKRNFYNYPNSAFQLTECYIPKLGMCYCFHEIIIPINLILIKLWILKSRCVHNKVKFKEIKD